MLARLTSLYEPGVTDKFYSSRESMLEHLNSFLEEDIRHAAAAGVHICLGTYVGTREDTQDRRTHYDPMVTARIFEELQADAFNCEYFVRSGTMESLRLKPRLGDKVIALGIVNVLVPEVETVEDVVRRIEEAARYVDLRNLAVCTNCGFSAASADAFINEDVQRQKLAVIAATAQRVWGTA